MVVVKELARLVQGYCAHVQRKLKLVNEIYEDNLSAVQLIDPGIIACVKGEDTVFVSSEWN